jgi:FKBP-type peptidyl-prolyl cis-trans isomerase FkpA
MSVTAVPLHPLKKGAVAKLWIALALLVALAAALAWAGTRNLIWTTTPTGLQYRIVKAGEGPRPTATDVALVDYTGKLEDGTVFDTSIGKQPMPMSLAPGAMIAGFTEGVQLMNKGATYSFRLPAKLAYGEAGSPPKIAPNTPLLFDVTLLEFLPEAQVRAMMQQQMMQQQMMQQQQGGAEAPPGR